MRAYAIAGATTWVRADLATSRRRTRVTMAVSVAAHALLLLWVVTLRQVSNSAPALVEVSWLEPGDAGAEPASPAPAARAPQTEAGLSRSDLFDLSYRRQERADQVAPEPQSDQALDDRIRARLATLQTREVSAVPGVARAGTTVPWSGPAPGPGGPGGAGTTPLALQRGGGGSAPLPLTHGEGGGGALLPASLPATRAAEASAPASPGEISARRTVAGGSLAGPVADRRIIHYTAPSYPDWAKREAVEGSVTLYFLVTPEGLVRENVLVQKTAGFEDFDENARVALRAWRFEPLHQGRTGDQWGTITFHYRLSAGG